MKGRCIITVESPPGTKDMPRPASRMALTTTQVERVRRSPGKAIIGASSTVRSKVRLPW